MIGVGRVPAYVIARLGFCESGGLGGSGEERVISHTSVDGVGAFTFGAIMGKFTRTSV